MTPTEAVRRSTAHGTIGEVLVDGLEVGSGMSSSMIDFLFRGEGRTGLEGCGYVEEFCGSESYAGGLGEEYGLSILIEGVYCIGEGENEVEV